MTLTSGWKWTMLALMVAFTSSLAAQAPVPTRLRAAGCYRLTLGRWSGALPPTGIPEAHTPPEHFRLDTAFARDTGWFVVDPRALVASSRMAASWKPIADSVRLYWSTGFVGVQLSLLAHGDPLGGLAKTFHDAHVVGEPPDPVASMIAVREPCR